MQPDDVSHLLQMLSAMMVQINALQTMLSSVLGVFGGVFDPLQNGLAELEQLTREALYQVRSASDDQPLAELMDVPFSEALARAIEDAAEKQRLSSRVQFSGEVHQLPASSERLLYRIVQETLYQIEQHRGARKLRLTVNYGHDEIQMNIEDDGVSSALTMELTNDLPAPPFNEPVDALTVPPFVNTRLTNSQPLDELRLRIERLGGSLEVISQIEQGTRVQVRLPYQQAVTPQSNVQSIQPQLMTQLNPSAQIRVLVVDSQAVTRAGLQRLLDSYPDLHVIGGAADGVQAVSETVELGPQVVLMDMQLPKGQSLEALRQIKQLNADTRVLLLSAQDHEDDMYETLRAGANGYVLKDIAPDELAQAVRAVAHGEMLVRTGSRSNSAPLTGNRRALPLETLTARELEVLQLLARGMRNKEIAARLYVSERTVNFHLANIYQKLNVSGRTEALSRAHEYGLITL